MKHLLPLNESDNSYSKLVKVEPLYSRISYNGKEIDEIIFDDIRLKFFIEVEGRDWGIKNISLYGISGPLELSARIVYYDDDGSLEEENLTFSCDWKLVETEEFTDKGVLTVDHVEVQMGIIEGESGILAGPYGNITESGPLEIKRTTVYIDKF